MTRTRTRTRRPTDPRDQAEALGYDTGSRGIAVEVEHVAIGTRATHPRARRADPLNRVADCTAAHRTAAGIYRQAHEHVQAGRGMGPLPWAAERATTLHRGTAAGVALLPQEAAVSAAEWHRRGVQAMGLAAAEGVVNWVVIRGGALAHYDDIRRWRKGTACGQLVAALDRLAEAYGCA
jgi:hypothetical protein